MKAMIQKTDEEKCRYEIAKTYSIQLGKSWVECLVKRYIEPLRAGTPKGQSIGLSSQKYRAALLMILYSRFGLSLKEIAKIAGVSEGLIRLWRTESDFKKVVQDTYASFGEQIANTIDLLTLKSYKKIGWKDKENIFENQLLKSPHFNFIKFPFYGDPKNPISSIVPLCDMVPFFNEAIFPVIAKRLKKRIDAGSLYHVYIAQRIMRSSVVKDKKKFRKWTIENLEFIKIQVESDLEFLTKPGGKEKDRKKFMVALRDTIFHTLEILAS
jgi:hypothetical protein